jgi:uncharacterized coiled-coil protein SlyX
MEAGSWISLAALGVSVAAGLIGYGRLDGRTKALEDRVSKVEEAIKAVNSLATDVAKIAERTANTKEAVERIEKRLNEPQSFSPRSKPPGQSS